MDTTVWCEFPFVDDDGGGVNVVARLTTLLDVATRLHGEGWPLRLTMTGLAFETPEGRGADELLRLGIEEPFTDSPSRTPTEVLEAVGQFHDSLRERALNAEEVGRLRGLYWALGVDTPSARPGGPAIQADALSA